MRARRQIAPVSAIRSVLFVFFISTVGTRAWADEQPADDAKRMDASPVLKRILANWKARQERIRSFHVTWESRIRLAAGRQIVMAANGRLILFANSDSQDAPWDLVPAASFWMSRNDEFRYERRVHWNVGSRFALDSPNVVTVSNGRSEKCGLQRPNRQFDEMLPGVLRSTRPSDPMLPRTADRDQGRCCIELVPMMLTFRPMDPKSLGWDTARCRLVTEHAIVDGIHYVKLQRSDESPGVLDTWWIDPRQDDVVTQWRRTKDGRDVAKIAIEYDRQPPFGPIPGRWTIESFVWDTLPVGTIKFNVTECKLNQEPPPDTFALQFPRETLVVDRATQNMTYLRTDGSERPVTKEELLRGLLYHNADAAPAKTP